MPQPKTSRRQLPAHIKNQIIGFLQVDKSFAEASRHFDVNEDTIQRIWNRFKITGSVENHRRSGRPPKLTAADRRHIVRMA